MYGNKLRQDTDEKHTHRFNDHFPGKLGLAACPLDIWGLIRIFKSQMPFLMQNRKIHTVFTNTHEEEEKSLSFCVGLPTQCPKKVCEDERQKSEKS